MAMAGPKARHRYYRQLHTHNLADTSWKEKVIVAVNYVSQLAPSKDRISNFHPMAWKSVSLFAPSLSPINYCWNGTQVILA